VRLLVESWVLPVGYVIVVASAGRNASGNVVGLREHPDAAQQGLRQIAGYGSVPGRGCSLRALLRGGHTPSRGGLRGASGHRPYVFPAATGRRADLDPEYRLAQGVPRWRGYRRTMATSTPPAIAVSGNPRPRPVRRVDKRRRRRLSRSPPKTTSTRTATVITTAPRTRRRHTRSTPGSRGRGCSSCRCRRPDPARSASPYGPLRPGLTTIGSNFSAIASRSRRAAGRR
jgi:hypothetical protein